MTGQRTPGASWAPGACRCTWRWPASSRWCGNSGCGTAGSGRSCINCLDLPGAAPTPKDGLDPEGVKGLSARGGGRVFGSGDALVVAVEMLDLKVAIAHAHQKQAAADALEAVLVDELVGHVDTQPVGQAHGDDGKAGHVQGVAAGKRGAHRQHGHHDQQREGHPEQQQRLIPPQGAHALLLLFGGGVGHVHPHQIVDDGHDDKSQQQRPKLVVQRWVQCSKPRCQDDQEHETELPCCRVSLARQRPIG